MVAVLNLWNTLQLFGGGPGSGCNPAVGDCGRPAGPGQPQKEKKWRKYDARKVGGYFRHGTMIARMYQTLAAKDGQWHKISDFEKEYEGSAYADVMNRLKEMRYTGKRAGLWKLDIDESNDRVRIFLNKQGQPALASLKKSPDAPEKTLNSDAPEVEKRLKNGAIITRKELGGGVNNAYMVVLDSGQKAVWKPGTSNDGGMRKEIKEGKTVEREVGAYELAKIVGMTDMVPAAVDRKVNGERGVMMEFRSGEVAHRALKNQQYDGKDGLAKAAVFDYVIGNEDRHKGNWLVDGKQIYLIDHGLAFPEKEESFRFNARMINRAADAGASGAPKDWAKPYVEHQMEIAGALKEVGLRDESIHGVMRRIGHIENVRDWKDLKDKNVRPGWDS